MKRNHSLKERISFKFDLIMSRGIIAKIMILILMTVVFIFIFGLLASIYLGDIKGLFFWTSWKTLMYTLDPGNLDGVEGSGLYIAMMCIATLYGMFFTAILIGLINDAISQKMDSLSRCRSTVIAEGHTVILGFNETTFVILHELFEANLNQKRKQVVIIMDDVDSIEMNEKMNEFISNDKISKSTRVFCRSGVIYDNDDLTKCSLLSSRAIIINATDDFNTIKAILACTNILNKKPEQTDSYTIAVIYNSFNEAAAKIAGCDGENNDRLVMLPLQKTLARIAVHTSRQPGLSKVFTELFSFSGNEFYIIESDAIFPRLYGKSIVQINHMLINAIAIGIFKAENGVIINDPNNVVFNQNDFLIVIQDDDNPLLIEDKPFDILQYPIVKAMPTEKSVCLVIGAKSITEDVLIEEPEYLSKQSEVIVADTKEMIAMNVSGNIIDIYKKHGIVLRKEEVNELYSRETINKLMKKYMPDSILILGNVDEHYGEDDDEEMLKVLLYLKEFKEKNKCSFNITCQLKNVINQKLASAIGSDDFIISKHIAALLMAQISQTRKVRQLFDSLLQSEGYELYIEKAAGYVPINKKLDLYSVIHAVSLQKKILIGIRQMKDGYYTDPVLNPKKYNIDGTLKKYIFGKDDYLVILAEEYTKLEQ